MVVYLVKNVIHSLLSILSLFLSFYRWHADAGLLAWDLLCLATVLGMISLFSLLSFSHFLIEFCVLLCWVNVHSQIKWRNEYGGVAIEASQASMALSPSSPLVPTLCRLTFTKLFLILHCPPPHFLN